MMFIFIYRIDHNFFEQIQFAGRLLTVFSSSKYCGGQNLAACIQCDEGKIRVLRMNTTDI